MSLGHLVCRVPGPSHLCPPPCRSPRCWWSRATLCRPVDALPHTGAPLLLCGPAFPGPLGAPLLPHLCLHQQRHQPHHLQPHVPEVPAAFQRLCGGGMEEPERRTAGLSSSSYGVDPRRRRPAGVRSRALRQLGPHSRSRGLVSAPSEGCPPPAQPLSPPSVCSCAGSCPLVAGRARRGETLLCQRLF